MDKTLPKILMIAGFGDNSSMYAGLCDTDLARSYTLVPLDLPGFGAPAQTTQTTLQSLAHFVAETARSTGAEIIMAHSVASIVASLAARQPACPLQTILSLEGNLTADDAYFSGTAADYDDPETFRTAFLARLDGMAEDDPVIRRYRAEVAKADRLALWQLGRDARRFSQETVPGEVLAGATRVIYFYNPKNCPQSSLNWLAENPMHCVVLADASHWPSVDQPHMLAQEIRLALD